MEKNKADGLPSALKFSINTKTYFFRTITSTFAFPLSKGTSNVFFKLTTKILSSPLEKGEDVCLSRQMRDV